MLVITHTHEAGTLIDGTAKGDGSGPILKRCGWRWGRSIAAWYIPYSRDRRPKVHIITRTRDELEAAGFRVSLDLDTTVRSAAEVEAAKAQRAEDRAEALHRKAETKREQESRAWAAADAARDSLPEGGEPIKVGHHSEGRHRRAIDTAHKRLGAAVDAHAAAEYAEGRLKAAQSATARRYAPATVARRIERLEAELRGTQRVLDGYTRSPGSPYQEWQPPAEGRARDHHLSVKDELTENLDYWKQVRAEQIAAGEATDYSKESVSKGDYVRVRGHWRKVVRANVKTVSVETGYTWTDKVPYHEIDDLRTA